MRKFLFVAAAVMAAGATAPAFAQSPDSQANVSQVYVSGVARDEAGHPTSLSRTVNYADLDLRKAQDQAVLRERVSDAAEGVCNELNLPLPNPANLGQSCQDQAIDGAMRQVDAAATYAMNQPPADPALAGPNAQTAAANTAATAPEAAPAAAATTPEAGRATAPLGD